MSAQMPGLPAPSLTSITAPYWQAAGEGRLLLQRCGACGVARHPPTAACYVCQSLDIDWFEHDGRGHVYTYVWTHRPVTPVFSHLGVFNQSVVELDDTPGPDPVRILARVNDVDKATLHVGLAVEVAFDPVELPVRDEDDPPAPIALPVFVPRS